MGARTKSLASARIRPQNYMHAEVLVNPKPSARGHGIICKISMIMYTCCVHVPSHGSFMHNYPQTESSLRAHIYLHARFHAYTSCHTHKLRARPRLLRGGTAFGTNAHAQTWKVPELGGENVLWSAFAFVVVVVGGFDRGRQLNNFPARKGKRDKDQWATRFGEQSWGHPQRREHSER